VEADMRVLVIGVLAVGCAADEPAGSFVAAADEGFVSLVVEGDEIAAYVCDGGPDGVTVAAWLSGTIEDDAFALSGDGVAIDGSLDGDGISGTADLPGGALAFDATAVADDAAEAGMFRAEGTTDDGGDVVGGWILDGAGDQRGAVLVSGTTQTAPALDPSVSTVTITVDGAAEQLQWARIVSPRDIVSPR
jgi:hypothetical protein